MDYCKQCESGGKVNILGWDSIGHCEEQNVYMNTCPVLGFTGLELYESAVTKSLRQKDKLLIVSTLRTGDADLRFYITTVQDG